MSSLFNSSSLGRSFSGLSSSSTPTPPFEADKTDGTSPTPSTASLPYQPRRRTPGGSASSIPPPLALAQGGAAGSRTAASTAKVTTTSSSPYTQTFTPPPPPGVQVTSPTSSTSTGTTPTTATIPRLFSNPVTPTTSTTDLSSSASLTASTDTITPSIPSSSLTPASVSSGVASTSAKNATGRLQLTNLKATAQQLLGLPNDSLGMKMLEALVQNGSSTSDWRAVVELLLEKKVTLLLPAAHAGTGEINVGVVRDHLALVELEDGSVRNGICVLLRSGLVGRLGEELSFESYLAPESTVFSALLNPSTRKSALASIVLPPSIPSSPSDGPADPAGSFPSVTPTLSALLPFPPPSPPPAADAVQSPQGSSKSNRRASLLPAAPRNPFAGLFGRPRAVSASPATPSTATDAPTREVEEKTAAENDVKSSGAAFAVKEAPAEVELQPTPPGSRPLSVRSNRSRSPSPARSTSSPSAPAKDLATTDSGRDNEEKQVHQVSALGISAVLKPADILKALGKAWRAQIGDELEDLSLPASTVKAVQRFACLPLPAAGQVKSTTAPPSAFKKAPPAGPPSALTVTLASLSGDPELVAGSYQEFYALVHEEIEVACRKEMIRTLAAEEEHVREEKREERERDIESRALAGVDAIEACLTQLHYNHLFSPELSSDKKHDEVLSSRVAGLCILGLTLDHLGVVTTLPDGGRNEVVHSGLEALVKEVGDELQKVSSPENFTPKTKTQVLVTAHKLVIERLRDLPPIRLRPEGEAPPASSAALGTSTPASSDALADPPANAPPVKESTPLPAAPAHDEPVKMIETDAISVKSDPLLVGGLEDAMAGSVLDIRTNPETTGAESAIQSPLDTPPLPSPVSPASLEAATAPPEASPTDAVNSEATSGADLLLPLIIYAVVKANPTQLVSHLLYIQRFRPTFAFSGEGSYALVNLTAVVDFLENVNLDSLGLAGEGKVLSANFQSFDEVISKDLAALSSPQAQAAAHSRLRGRVSQVSDFASSGLNNVAATGLGALRSLIENGQMAAEGFMIQVPGVTPTASRPTTLLGRKTSGFSIANLATSVAGIAASAGRRESSITGVSAHSSPAVGSGGQNNGAGAPGEWGVKREMVDVSSRPSSIYERAESSSGSDDDPDDHGNSDGERDVDDEPGSQRKESDARSIRSTRSVGSTRSLGNALKATAEETPIGSPSSARLSISERFARMSTGAGSAPGAESPVGLGVASGLPKATPFFSTQKTRSASNSVSSLTPSTRRATILGGATFIPPPSPVRPASITSPTDPLPSTTSSTPPIPLPPLSQAHLPSSPLTGSPGGPPPLPKRPSLTIEHREDAAAQDGTIRPPVNRFLACTDAGELRVGDVAELLREYQRLADVLRELGAWD